MEIGSTNLARTVSANLGVNRATAQGRKSNKGKSRRLHDNLSYFMCILCVSAEISSAILMGTRFGR